MTATPSPVFIEWLVGDLQVPCDYMERDWCCKSEAKWALFLACYACGHAQQRLAGTACKDLFVNTEDVVQCPVCEDFDRPKVFLTRIEAL
jgi:hypothetical protein